MARFDSEATIVETSYTRPDDTTQYTANDALSDSTSAPTALTFANCGRSRGAGGYVVGVTVISSANQATLPEFKLYLFDTAPTATNDNSEFDLSDADAVNLLGSFTLDGFAALDETSGADGNAEDQADSDGAFPLAFRCGTTSEDLYGLVKVLNGYTPVAEEVVTVRLHVEQD